MALRRIVILGTGTEVGKTYVATRLVELYQQEGGRCLALKPIESGVEDVASASSLVPTQGDAAALFRAASLGARPLYEFREALSPHLAARRAGRHIDLEHIVEYVRQQEEGLVSSSRDVETWLPPTVDLLDSSPPPSAEARSSSTNPPPSSNPSPSSRSGGPLPPICLIETAGGVFSPISETKTNWDLAQALRPDAIVLVAPDSLGVLHDVQATLRAIAPHKPHLLVLSESRPSDSSTGSNLAEIEQVVLSQLRLSLPCIQCPRGEQIAPSVFRVLSG